MGTRAGLDVFGEERNLLPPTGFGSPDPPVRGLVAIPSGGIDYYHILNVFYIIGRERSSLGLRSLYLLSKRPRYQLNWWLSGHQSKSDPCTEDIIICHGPSKASF